MENVGKINALMMVAHPDDCVIFGYPFYSVHKQFNWTICYLTYKKWELRAFEIAKFWKKRSVNTLFLEFLDDFRFVEQGITGFDNHIASEKITEVVQQYDFVLTHFEDGEYGHLHHMFIHDTVKKIAVPQVYFAGVDNANYQCVCQSTEYHLDELPTHQEVIAGFQDRFIGRYIVTDQARTLM